ncbi:PAS domain-containing sensor histidine kinase [Thiohalomonas denitrificans]|uniref:histidine kinase n=1 Tax=Thiohalomonas denitrificans TaxID=415747 RepID=A0A1G5PQF7_9GAMM|nr:PAS domain S-box protein [Thiohalomonas denitrificans]SCZ51683.1 PAS domain S-box-containing protein [Thiohalomonas denitrificans]
MDAKFQIPSFTKLPTDLSVFSLVPDPILVLDTCGLILRLNRAAEQFFGHDESELHGQLLSSLCHPDDAENLLSSLRQINKQVTCLEPYRFLMEGEIYRWIEWHARPTGEGNDPILVVGRDVTERRMANLKLRESERQLARGELIAGLGSWRWDSQSGERLWSDGFYQLLGLFPQSVKPSFELFCEYLPEDSREKLETAIQWLFDSGQAVEVEHTIVRSDGGMRLVQSRLQPLYAVDSKVIGYTGTALDITELSAARHALADSELRFRMLMEHATDAILVANDHGQLIGANRRAMDFFGYSKNELMAMGPLDLYPPEERKGVIEAFRDIDQAGQSLYQHTARRKNGSLVDVEVSGARVTDGETAIYLGIFRDVSERNRLQEEMRRKTAELEALFANLHVCIAVLDREFNFLRVNRAYCEMTGMPAEALVGRSHFDLYPHEENERIFGRTVATGKAHSAIAKVFEHPSLGATYWDWTLTPFTNQAGEVEGMVLSLIDVTEREQQRQAAESAWLRAQDELEQRVRERTTELAAANRELESFSYSVSHDLRGPLRAINGFSGALQEDCGELLNEDGHNYLQRIQSATLRMSDLIDGLLSLSRVFRTELERTDVDLSGLAEEIVRQLRSGAGHRQVSVDVEQGMTTWGDPTLIRLLLQNLFSNALKFTSNSPEPRISFVSLLISGRRVFVIRDNGIGFEMEYVHKLFQPFERLHDDKNFKGSGIGLATARRIVERHAGEVWVEAVPSQGASFYFTLGGDS